MFFLLSGYSASLPFKSLFRLLSHNVFFLKVVSTRLTFSCWSPLGPRPILLEAFMFLTLENALGLESLVPTTCLGAIVC